MDHLDQHLATSAVDLSLPASIRAAATLGKQTLNKYYRMTDLSEVYRIAMSNAFSFLFSYSLLFNWLFIVLHPRHKLEYFKKAGWDNVWTETAKQIVRDEFERSYKTQALAAADTNLTSPKRDSKLTKVGFLNISFTINNW